MKKRLLQLLLCVALCLTLLPVTASAADVRWFCGTCGSSAGSSCGHSDYSVPYTVITSNTKLPTEAGHYYLDHAVTLSYTWAPKGTVVLYMDYGAVIYGPNGKDTVGVLNCTFTLTGPYGGTGTITHKSGQLGRGVRVYEGDTFNMYQGVITGNTVAYSHELDHRGGGVYNAGTFNMYGGTISNNNLAMDRSTINKKDYVGGGVCNVGIGTFNMHGGTISGNRATVGGGVHNRGTFKMCGGEISQNEVFSGFHITGEVGGGVYVDKGGNFIMSGGTIKDNKAASGGGVYVSKTYVASKTDNPACFTLDGGTISSNTATNGGGIYRCEGTTMKLNGGTLDLNSATNGGGLYIEGTGTDTFTIDTAITRNDADYGGGVYTSGTVTLKSTTIGQGKVSGAKGNLAMKQGGGVYVNGTLTMENCTVTGNRAVTHGGGVYVAKGKTFTMSGGTITENQVGNGKEDAARYGGGVFNAGTMTINGSAATISYNAKYGSRGGEKLDGAGIYNNGTLTMNSGTIGNNTGKHGAAVYVASGKTFHMNGGTLENNRSSGGSGGAVCVLGTFNMTNATIKNNSTNNLGGGVYIPEGGTFNMNAGSLISNCRGEHGGGVFNQGTFNMTSATIDHCTATNSTGHGGGLCADAPAKLVGAIISNNTADLGGGVFVGQPDALTMDANTQIISNTAKKGNNPPFSRGSGGGIYVFNGASLTLNGGTIAHNTATNGGGIGGEGTLTLSGSVVVSNNTATNDGGGLYLYERAAFTVNDGARIENNSATHGGGGAFNTSPQGLTINGGTISGNSANNGGGIYNSSGRIAESFMDALSKEQIYNPSKGPVLNLNGGTITGNTARTRGGGVFAIDGGKDTETRVRISGTASVVGNTVSDKANNIYLDGTDLQIVRTGFFGTAGITKKDAKINETRILTTYIEYFQAPDVVSQYAHRFAYDDPDFAIKTDGWLGCAHKNVDESGACTDCGAEGFVFKVVSGAQKGSATNYYQRLETAMSALTDGGTLTLLADVPATMELNSPVTYTLDMNGKKADAGICVSAGSVTIKNCTAESGKPVVDVNGGEAVIPDGIFGNVNVGGGTATISGGTFNRLTVNSGNARLSGGTFSVIRNFRGGDRGTAGALLAENYGYWNEDKEDWRDDRYQVVENTTVKSTLVALEITPEDASVTYGTVRTLTANMVNWEGNAAFTYSWTLDGDAVTGNGNSYTLPATTNAGEHIVKCVATCADGSYTATKTVTVNPKALTADDYTAPAAENDLAYDGTAQNLVTGGSISSISDGKILFLQPNGTWAEAIPTGTDAGTYTVKYYIDGGANYGDVGSPESPLTVEANIAPKTIEVDEDSIVLAQKYYDTTKTASVVRLGFKESANTSARAIANTVDGVSFEITKAEFDSPDVNHVNNKVSINVKLLGENHSFIGNTKEVTVYKSASISPITLSNTNALQRYLNAGKTYTYDLNELISGLTGRAEFGTITWHTNPTFVYESGKAPAAGEPSDTYTIDTDSTLTIKINSRDSLVNNGKIGTLSLTATAPCFLTGTEAGIRLTIDVYLAEKTVPVRGDQLIEKTSITYGQPLSESRFATGSYLVEPDTNTQVPGTFSWVNPTRVPNVGIRWAEWLFTPDNDGTTHYQPVNGAGAVTVNKATPTVYLIGEDTAFTGGSITRTYNGSPITFQAKHYIYTVSDDATTGSYVLTPVSGTWTWKQGTTTVSAPVNAQSSQTYTVTFTPSDTTNYNSVTFEVTVTITPKTLTITGVNATGRIYEPNNVKVTLSGGRLDGVADSDTTRVSFSLGEGTMDDANAGDDKSVTTHITLIGNAAGNYTLTQPTDVKVTITPKTLTRSMVTMDTSYLTYNGSQQSPSFTIKDGDTALTDATYTVSGDTAKTDKGSYTLTITGQGNYTTDDSPLSIPWYIDPKPITADMVTITAPTYNGNEQRPTVTVTGGATYTVSGDTATDVGSRTLTIEGNGNYEGRLPLTWSLKPKTINASASVADKRYDGTTNATGTVALTGGLRALEEDRDYLYTAAFADADAGTDKAAYVQVTLLNPNYCFNGGLSTITLNCTADITGTSGNRYHGGSSISAESAPTGDAGIALYAALALTSCTGSALVLRSKKREF